MSELLVCLNHANQNLQRLLEMLAGDDDVHAITSDGLASILTELLRVGEHIQNEPPAKRDPEISCAIRVYRGHLERLHFLMPTLHARLLTERARLEGERSHLEAASAWAGTSKAAF